MPKRKELDHDLRQAVGARLRESRNKTGLTLEKVAEQLKVTRNMVTLWEMGRSFPRPENLAPLAKLYSISVDWLMGQVASEDIDLQDPDLSLFFRGEWNEFTEEEKEFVKGMIRESRELLRKRRERSE